MGIQSTHSDILEKNSPPLRKDRFLELEKKKRSFLIYALSVIGSAVCIIFGFQNLTEGYQTTGIVVLVTALINCINLIHFFYSKNADRAANVINLILLLLGWYLLVSGGYKNTGILWIYPLVAILVFLNSFWISLTLSLIFIYVCIFLLFIPDVLIITANYPTVVKIRFLFTLTVLLTLCLTVEFSQHQSKQRVLSLSNQLLHAANTDSLTQLPNRRYLFDNYFVNDRIQGTSSLQAILLCDVDNFKTINDTLGHDVGDKVLQEVAHRLRKAIRKSDIIARWGGEEFMILLPNASQQIATERAEILRESVCRHPINFGDQRFEVTISIGVASTQEHDSAKVIFKIADDRLYKAKAEGKNRVC